MSMPKKVLPRILSVAPGEKALSLKLRWNTGDDSMVDVSGPVNSFRFYAPLRNNLGLFRQVRVGEHGTDGQSAFAQAKLGFVEGLSK